MKKTNRKASRLTSKSTDEEVIRWTKSHDVFDRLETGVSEVVEDHNDLDEVLREGDARRARDGDRREQHEYVKGDRDVG